MPYAAALVLGASPFQMGLLSSTGALSILLFGLFAEPGRTVYASVR